MLADGREPSRGAGARPGARPGAGSTRSGQAERSVFRERAALPERTAEVGEELSTQHELVRRIAPQCGEQPRKDGSPASGAREDRLVEDGVREEASGEHA